ncbi:MAG: hypothetical protein AAF495_29070 [Pseudomonadota bacterium]
MAIDRVARLLVLGLLLAPCGPLMAQTADGQAPALDLSVDKIVVEESEEQKRRRALNIDPIPEGDSPYMDLSETESGWDAAPVMMGRTQDGSASRSRIAVPVGVEVKRDF